MLLIRTLLTKNDLPTNKVVKFGADSINNYPNRQVHLVF